MATQSTIEWTEQTWNPTTGCTKVSPGCKHCYAEVMARRLHAWTEADQALWAGVLNFWFLGRVFDRVRP